MGWIVICQTPITSFVMRAVVVRAVVKGAVVVRALGMRAAIFTPRDPNHQNPKDENR